MYTYWLSYRFPQRKTSRYAEYDHSGKSITKIWYFDRKKWYSNSKKCGNPTENIVSNNLRTTSSRDMFCDVKNLCNSFVVFASPIYFLWRV